MGVGGGCSPPEDPRRRGQIRAGPRMAKQRVGDLSGSSVPAAFISGGKPRQKMLWGWFWPASFAVRESQSETLMGNEATLYAFQSFLVV